MLSAKTTQFTSAGRLQGSAASALCVRAVPAMRSRKQLVARSQKDEFHGSSTPGATSISQLAGVVRTEADRFFKRYDVVSTGMGALAVTGYCFYRGQDFGTAMSITFMSTIAALVINEVTSGDCN